MFDWGGKTYIIRIKKFLKTKQQQQQQQKQIKITSFYMDSKARLKDCQSCPNY